METLLRLVQEPDVDTYYLDGGSAVLTQNTNTVHEEHRPVFYQLPDWDLERFIVGEFQTRTNRVGRGRRLAHGFIESVHPVGVSPDVLTSVLADCANRDFIERVAFRLLESLAPAYQLGRQTLEFRIVDKRVDDAGSWAEVRTNIDWRAATRAWRERSGVSNELNPAFVLSSALSIQEHLYFASLYSSDLAVDPLASMLIEEKCSELLLARRRHEAQIADFQLNVAQSAHSVAEAINQGQRSLAELLDLLDHARRFRRWVADQEPDESLLQNYISEVSASSWVEGLPSKIIRWAFIAGLGVALGVPDSLVAGPALGLADALLTERLLGGWRPNRFVDDNLAPFVSGT